ncbi:DsrH/TusB family sulfur relay protein [Methanobacterium alcaliphilum]|uniref:DsrH/TusB family sulfur relay protein n=1 Tax=Methanobacterium alcaliphilum TaxID=392018 RepID=UPI00200B2E48|nr:DsrH/TusB family sulfur relay protein [Methanobacterium alcaliphilum]MCK9151086.1 DsrH/TusB family sulfur relay protein [Methanobacterium alcaliphilum]
MDINHLKSGNMHIAFIITKTPQEPGFSSFIQLLNLYADENEIYIYLIGNGVYCATHGHGHSELINTLSKKNQVWAYDNDILARGIHDKHIINGITTFNDYGKLVVDIMEKMDQVLSF